MGLLDVKDTCKNIKYINNKCSEMWTPKIRCNFMNAFFVTEIEKRRFVRNINFHKTSSMDINKTNSRWRRRLKAKTGSR